MSGEVVIRPAGELPRSDSGRWPYLPLAGATVTLLCQDRQPCGTQTTDAGGGYRFAGLKPGEYEIRIEAPGYYREELIPYMVRAGFETGNRPADLERCPPGDCTVRPKHLELCM